MKPKILIIRFSSLGDLILTTAFYRELKKVRPDAELHLVTSKEFAPLFAHCPHIKKLYQFDRRSGTDALDELATKLKQEDWDEVFDLHQSLRSRLLLIKLFGSFYRWKKKIHRIDKRSLKRNLLISLKMNFLKSFPSQRASYLKLLEASYPNHESGYHTELFT
ncbi:MAG: glycosyltransferase family 9 protein, partial [SAR324 cluster bacterium]|nr:glycosyltransferase family 9 protein [SAR324 cluster bacterium]